MSREKRMYTFRKTKTLKHSEAWQVTFKIKYHHDAKEADIQLIDPQTKKRIKKVIEVDLITAPHKY